jgi:hypothetical protein
MIMNHKSAAQLGDSFCNWFKLADKPIVIAVVLQSAGHTAYADIFAAKPIVERHRFVGIVLYPVRIEMR